MTFDEIYDKIQSNKQNADNGYMNCIPFHGFERLKPYMPGIIKGEYYLVTGSSGSGKSKLARTLFIHDPYQYIKKHPETGIDFDVLYWSLEEDVEKIYATELSRLLKTKFDISIGYRQLMSIGKTFDYDILNKLKQCKEEFNDWKDHIHVYGTEDSNPYGIFKRVKEFCYTKGRFYDKEGNPFTDDMMDDVKGGVGEVFKRIFKFKFDNPRHHVIVLIDHVSLIRTQEGLDLTKSIYKLSTEYLLTLKNVYGCIPVIVQQQNSLKEKLQFTAAGNSIQEKLEPSLDSLADCTTTQREATIAFGIFGPHRYGIASHSGYDINILKDHYRSLSLLKQRDDRANLKLPLFFIGESDYFMEMPNHDNRELLDNIYEYSRKLK